MWVFLQDFSNTYQSFLVENYFSQIIIRLLRVVRGAELYRALKETKRKKNLSILSF